MCDSWRVSTPGDSERHKRNHMVLLFVLSAVHGVCVLYY